MSSCVRCGAPQDQECRHVGEVCCDCAELEVEAWFEGQFDGRVGGA